MPQQKSKAGVGVTVREGIVGANACTMCLYNIPRSSLMITVPGLVILVCGAAMIGFLDRGQSWTDGIAMVALVCLALGGAWTVGGLVFWLVAWCRLKPAPKARRMRRSNVISAAYDNRAVQLTSVTSQACEVSPELATELTNDRQRSHITHATDKTDQLQSVPDDVIYTVP